MKSMCEYPFVLVPDPRNKQNEEGTRFTTADLENGNGGLLSRGGLPRISTGVSGQRSINKSFTTINGPAAS